MFTRKRLWRWGLVVLLLLAAGYGVQAWLVPRAAEHLLRQKWRELGLPELERLAMERAGLGGLTVREMEARGLTIQRMRVTYRLDQLRRGRVGTVDLEGVAVEATLVEGRWICPVWEWWRQAQKTAPAVAERGAGFDLLRARGEWVLKLEEAGTLRLPLAAMVDRDAAGQRRVHGSWEGLPWPVQVFMEEDDQGKTRFRGSVQGPAGTMRVDLDRGQIRARGSVHGSDWALQGRLDQDEQGRMRLEANLEGWDHPWRVVVAQEGRDWDVRVQQGEAGQEIVAGHWSSAAQAWTVQPATQGFWVLPDAWGWKSRLERILVELGVHVQGWEHVKLTVRPQLTWRERGQWTFSCRVGLAADQPLRARFAEIHGEMEGIDPDVHFVARMDDQGIEIQDIAGELSWQAGRFQGATLGFGSMKFRGWARQPWRGASRGLVHLEANQSESQMPEAALVCRELHLALPIAWGAAAEESGFLHLREASWMGRSLGELKIRLKWQGGRLTWDAPWPAPGNVGLFTQGRLELGGWGNLDGEVKASLTGLEIADPQTLRRAFPGSGLEIIDLAGVLEAHGVFTASRGSWKPWVTLYVRDGMVASRRFDMEARGIEAKIDLDTLAPPGPGSPPFQWLTVREANVGRLALRDGLIQFQMQTPRSFLVERTRWTMGERGRFWIHGFWMDPTAEKIEMEVFLEDVSLRDIFHLTGRDSLSGEGLIYGRIPVAIHPQGDPMLRLGQGFLYGRPGRGWVEIKDRGMIDHMMQEGGLSVGDQIRERFVSALSDFEYTMLRLELSREDNLPARALAAGVPVLVRLSIEGKGRRGVHPIEFSRLTINLRGVEDLLDLGLRIQRERNGARQWP